VAEDFGLAVQAINRSLSDHNLRNANKQAVSLFDRVVCSYPGSWPLWAVWASRLVLMFKNAFQPKPGCKLLLTFCYRVKREPVALLSFVVECLNTCAPGGAQSASWLTELAIATTMFAQGEGLSTDGSLEILKATDLFLRKRVNRLPKDGDLHFLVLQYVQVLRFISSKILQAQRVRTRTRIHESVLAASECTRQETEPFRIRADRLLKLASSNAKGPRERLGVLLVKANLEEDGVALELEGKIDSAKRQLKLLRRALELMHEVLTGRAPLAETTDVDRLRCLAERLERDNGWLFEDLENATSLCEDLAATYAALGFHGVACWCYEFADRLIIVGKPNGAYCNDKNLSKWACRRYRTLINRTMSETNVHAPTASLRAVSVYTHGCNSLRKYGTKRDRDRLKHMCVQLHKVSKQVQYKAACNALNTSQHEGTEHPTADQPSNGTSGLGPAELDAGEDSRGKADGPRVQRDRLQERIDHLQLDCASQDTEKLVETLYLFAAEVRREKESQWHPDIALQNAFQLARKQVVRLVGQPAKRQIPADIAGATRGKAAAAFQMLGCMVANRFHPSQAAGGLRTLASLQEDHASQLESLRQAFELCTKLGKHVTAANLAAEIAELQIKCKLLKDAKEMAMDGIRQLRRGLALLFVASDFAEAMRYLPAVQQRLLKILILVKADPLEVFLALDVLNQPLLRLLAEDSGENVASQLESVLSVDREAGSAEPSSGTEERRLEAAVHEVLLDRTGEFLTRQWAPGQRTASPTSTILNSLKARRKPSLLVRYFALESKLYVCSVLAGNSRLEGTIKILDCNVAWVKNEAAKLENRLLAENSSAVSPDCAKHFWRLSESLLKPLQDQIANSELITFLVSEDFGNVPLHVLPFSNNKPLFVTHEVTYLPSLQAGEQISSETNPGYDRLVIGVDEDTDAGIEAAAEAKAVKDILQEGLNRVLSPSDNTQARERLLSTYKYSYAHLACHGVSDAGCSQVVLDPNGMRITEHDYLKLGAKADFIFVNSCQAAEPSLLAGRTVGFATAFILRGARTCLLGSGFLDAEIAKEYGITLAQSVASGREALKASISTMRQLYGKHLHPAVCAPYYLYGLPAHFATKHPSEKRGSPRS